MKPYRMEFTENYALKSIEKSIWMQTGATKMAKLKVRFSSGM